MPTSAHCHSSFGSPLVVHEESLAVPVHDQLVNQLLAHEVSAPSCSMLVHEVPRVVLVQVLSAPSCSSHPTLRPVAPLAALAVLGLLHELVPLELRDLVLGVVSYATCPISSALAEAHSSEPHLLGRLYVDDILDRPNFGLVPVMAGIPKTEVPVPLASLVEFPVAPLSHLGLSSLLLVA